MAANFVSRKEMTELEWDFEKVDWKRPEIDKSLMKELVERNSFKGFLRLGLLIVCLGSSAAGFILLKEHSIIASIVPLYIYYFFFGFIVAVGHELQHKIVFSKKLDWLSEIFFYIAQFLMWNSPRYSRISHKLHHKYTMVRGIDPETNWPDVITGKWLKRLFFKLILKILVLGGLVDLLKAIKLQIERTIGVKDRMMKNQCSDQDNMIIRLESFLILIFHLLTIFISVYFQRWELILLIVIAWHIGSGIETMWHMTEHVARPYNVNDHRVNTRSVKVSPFTKLIYWGLDDHVEHHIFPGVPSCNLPRLHRALVDYVPDAKNAVDCWKEMFATAYLKDQSAELEYIPTLNN